MKAKAIVFDLDGTAIDSPSEKTPTERLTIVVQKLQQEYFLCAATGRSWTFGKPVIQGLYLQDLYIISGGTQICDPTTGEVIWQKDITPQALNQVIEIFKENGQQPLIYNDYSEDDYFNGSNPKKSLRCTCLEPNE